MLQRTFQFVLAASTGSLLSMYGFDATAATVVNELPPVPLYGSGAPGSEDFRCPERMTGALPDRFLFNVSSPTYQPFLPSKEAATGTAVIIAPGGGFQMIAIDNEGIEVAKWLAARGIASFVLKYRVAQTDPNNPPRIGLGPESPKKAPDSCVVGRTDTAQSIEQRGQMGIADGVAAIQAIRSRAALYRIDPKRVVMLGFSAGAMVTAGTALQSEPALRPNYAAPIYGAIFGTLPPIPKDLPPIFLVMAQNDLLVGPAVHAFYDALYSAGYRPEIHLYNGGNHGFGMHTLGTTSDHWKETFYWWMESYGLTQQPGASPRPETPAFARPKWP